MLASAALMAVTQPAAAEAAAPSAAGPRGARPRAVAALAVALIAACAYAAFADGATGTTAEARLDAAIVLIARAAAAVWLNGGVVAPRATRAGWISLALFGGFALWCGLSLAWSVAPDATWTETNRAIAYTLVVGCAFALGAAVDEIAIGLLGVASAVALWALAGKVVPGVLDDTATVARLRAPLGYWNALALLCAMAAPVAIALACDRARRGAWRLAALASLWLLVVVAGLTYSRGGILALAVAVAVLVVLGEARLRALGALGLAVLAATPGIAYGVTRDALNENGAPLHDRIAAGGVLAGILAVSLLALLGAGWVVLRFESRITPPERLIWRALAALALIGVVALLATGVISRSIDSFGATRDAPSTSDPSRVLSTNSGNRLVWWKEAFGAFTDRPVAGYGAGSFPVIHLQYRKNQLEVRQPHDVPLEFLSETGLIGGVLGVGAVVALLAAAFTGARARGGPAIALLAAGAAWAAHALVDWDWDIPGVTVPALVALGALAGLPPPARVRRSPARRGLLALAGLAACLYLVSVALPAWSQSKADSALASAREDATPQQLQGAAARADLASRLDPLDVDSLFAAAAIADRRERLLEERRFLLDAVGRQPSDAGAWERLALVAVRLGDGPGAIEASAAGLKLDPRNRRLLKLARDTYAFNTPPQNSPTATGTPLP